MGGGRRRERGVRRNGERMRGMGREERGRKGD